MAKVVYEIVEHGAGWAFWSSGSYSETFGSAEAARVAAERIARAEQAAGEAVIWYEGLDGRCHEQVVV